MVVRTETEEERQARVRLLVSKLETAEYAYAERLVAFREADGRRDDAVRNLEATRKEVLAALLGRPVT